jgi:hypothetical protein
MGAGQQTYGGEFGVLPSAHANAGVYRCRALGTVGEAALAITPSRK